MKISDIYHMDIYSDNGQYLGDVQDVVVDLERGEISRLLMVSWKNARSDMKNLLKQKSILYKNVRNVGDVVLVSSLPGATQEMATREEVSDLTK